MADAVCQKRVQRRADTQDGILRLGQNRSHIDEAVDHVGEGYLLDRHLGAAQLCRIGNGLIAQGIKARMQNDGRGEARSHPWQRAAKHVCRAHRGGPDSC